MGALDLGRETWSPDCDGSPPGLPPGPYPRDCGGRPTVERRRVRALGWEEASCGRVDSRRQQHCRQGVGGVSLGCEQPPREGSRR